MKRIVVVAGVLAAGVAGADPSGFTQAEKDAVKGLTVPHQRRDALAALGQKLEAKGDTAGAVKVYADALDERSDHFIREKIIALDPAAGARVDLYRATPMTGPLDAAPKSGGDTIALKVGGKWFTREIQIGECRGGKVKEVSRDKHDDLTVIRVEATCGDLAEEGVVLIGVGKSGTPNATLTITTKLSEDGDLLLESTWKWGKGASIDVDVPTAAHWGDGMGRPSPEALIGHHVFVFP